MSTAARIDELRKKFEENPRRYFAPLANELRKAGNLSEAITLCREFLPKQPEHMSGYIVFGQALYESGELPEARTVFEQALALDPENLKALRHLGDIAKHDGDTAAARRWYERVLEADPRNDDIAAQLTTLATPAYSVPAMREPDQPPPGTPEPERPVLFTPNAFTPAFSLTPVGLGAIPTPDAALRAVDFDEVNARLREPEQQVAPVAKSTAPRAMSEPASLVEAELLDLDSADEAEAKPNDDAEVDACDVEPVSEPVAAEPADDPFGFDDPPISEDFEEGLIAPDWPDTSELVARAVTPRTVTPAFVASLTPDAVSAFGAEPTDPVQLQSTVVEQGGEATHADEQPHVEQPEVVHPDSEIPLGVNPPLDATPEVAANVEEPVLSEPEWIELAPRASSEELPWLMPEADESQSVLFESADAKTADEAADITTFESSNANAHDDDEDNDVESSFADVMPEDSASAFVTETMGELLVSQGFTARAITVYEELVRRRPYDPVLTSRLTELQQKLADELAPLPYGTVASIPTPSAWTPSIPTPAVASAAVRTPWAPTPAIPATPVSAAPHDDLSEPAVPQLTAKERFARLAARRVPRRTPPRASVAVETPAQGLASLFGNDTFSGDDLAARTLADAFAPIDQQAGYDDEMSFEQAMLDTPRRSATPLRSVTPIRSQTALASAAVAEPTAGPFSFDRFFPDPATGAPSQSSTNAHELDGSAHQSPRATPGPTPEVVAPKVSDDLAQFSAWLKGLGNA